MATNNLKIRGESVLTHSIKQYRDDSYHKTEQGLLTIYILIQDSRFSNSEMHGSLPGHDTKQSGR